MLHWIVAAATIITANHNRRSQAGPASSAESVHTSRRASTIIVDTSSVTNVNAVIATLATGIPIQANGLNTMAASGG